MQEEGKRDESHFNKMFAKANRFSFNNGIPKKMFQAPFFVLRYDYESKKGLECAVVVGKKVSKKAAERNRLKRKIISLIKPELSSDKNLRIVMYAKKGASEEKFEEFEKSLRKAFAELKLI